MGYSLKYTGGKVRFLKDGEPYWALPDDIEICDNRKYRLWSEDGNRLSFCGWHIDYDEGENVYQGLEEIDLPITIVADLPERRFLSVYLCHIQPLQWNDTCDDIVVPDEAVADKRRDGSVWQAQNCSSPSSAGGNSAKSSVNTEFLERKRIEEETARLEMWARVAPDIADVNALEDELTAINLPFLEAGTRKPCDETLFRMAVKNYLNRKFGKTDALPKQDCKPESACIVREDARPNTPADELAARWPSSPRRRKVGKSLTNGKLFQSNNILIIVVALAISIFWICCSIFLYASGHVAVVKGGAYIGVGVLVAILARLFAHYELRFDRKFLMWRLLVIFSVSFSSLSYQIARGVNYLIVSILGRQPEFFNIFWIEMIPLSIMLVLGTAMSRKEADERKAKRWAWLGTVSLTLLIGAFVFAAMSNK